MPTLTHDVKEMRSRAIEFVKSKGGEAGRSEIKAHLGLDPVVHWPCFDRAMKTAKLKPVYRLVEVSPGLFLSRPIVTGYRLARPQTA